MLDFAVRWKTSALIGAGGIVIGLILMVWPEIVLGVAVVIYGAYSIAIGLVDGGAVLFSKSETTTSRGLLLVLAVVNIVVGALLVTATRQTMSVVLAIAGFLIAIEGAARLVRLMRSGLRGLPLWVYVAAAICELLIGLWFALRPVYAGVASVAFLGALLLAFGIVSLGAGLALRASDAVGGGPMTPA